MNLSSCTQGSCNWSRSVNLPVLLRLCVVAARNAASWHCPCCHKLCLQDLLEEMIEIALEAVNTAKLEDMGDDIKLASKAGDFEKLWANQRVPKDVRGLRNSVVRPSCLIALQNFASMFVCLCAKYFQKWAV